jgi:hypothetical protein
MKKSDIFKFFNPLKEIDFELFFELSDFLAIYIKMTYPELYYKEPTKEDSIEERLKVVEDRLTYLDIPKDTKDIPKDNNVVYKTWSEYCTEHGKLEYADYIYFLNIKNIQYPELKCKYYPESELAKIYSSIKQGEYTKII